MTAPNDATIADLREALYRFGFAHHGISADGLIAGPLAPLLAERDALRVRAETAEAAKDCRGADDDTCLWTARAELAEARADTLAADLAAARAALEPFAKAGELFPGERSPDDWAGMSGRLSEDQEANLERALMRLEAEADAWLAETPEIGEAVRSISRCVVLPFQNRAGAQVDAIVRHVFCEAFYRGFNAHRDLPAGRTALSRHEGAVDER